MKFSEYTLRIDLIWIFLAFALISPDSYWKAEERLYRMYRRKK